MIIDMGSIELGPGETAAATTASFGGQSRSILSFFEPKRTPTGLPLIGRLRGTGLVPPPPQAGPLPPPAPPFTPSPTVPQQPARLTSFVHGALLKQDNPRPAQPATSSGLPFKNGIYFEPPVPRQPFLPPTEVPFQQPQQQGSLDSHVGNIQAHNPFQDPNPAVAGHLVDPQTQQLQQLGSLDSHVGSIQIHNHFQDPIPTAAGHLIEHPQTHHAALSQAAEPVPAVPTTPAGISRHTITPLTIVSSLQRHRPSPPLPDVITNYRQPIYPNRPAAPSTEPDYSNYDSSRQVEPPLRHNDVPVFVPLPRKPFLLPSSPLDLDPFTVAKEIRYKSQQLDSRPEKNSAVDEHQDNDVMEDHHPNGSDDGYDPQAPPPYHDQAQPARQQLPETTPRPIIVKALLPPPPTQKVHHFHYHYIPTPIPLLPRLSPSPSPLARGIHLA